MIHEHCIANGNDEAADLLMLSFYNSIMQTLSIKTKPAFGQSKCGSFWRSGWDSNPRTVARHLISSQGRYDHFDTTPS